MRIKVSASDITFVLGCCANLLLVISVEKACQCASVTYGELCMHFHVLYAFLEPMFYVNVALL